MRLLAVIALSSAAVGITTATAQDLGDLLVAADRLGQEEFAETVVLLVHYGEEGAVGVAINRPTWVSAREVFPRFEYLHGYRGRVFHGGPLAQATVLVLTRGLAPSGDSQPLIDDVYMHADLNVLENAFDRREHDASVLRFYAGHASWGPGQLEEEIAAGAWRVVPGNADAIFDPQPASLWRRLTERDEQLTVDAQPARAPLDRNVTADH